MTPDTKYSLTAGSTFILISIVLGAFGAHALKSALSPEQLDSFLTGVRYSMYNGLGLIGLGLAKSIYPKLKVQVVRWLIIVGTVLFSSSIFLLATREISHLDNIGWMGPITPIGGSLMILGWAMLVINLIRYR
ncbi:MAG TPA: DUF423 domain-containing protein [Flavobacteriales bacterium]|jgi:uncharacterized membrane protein YgdD (TMEM256/DUF423 family)|nr:DUF423 domain-containing protein [Flavobacteriales bacterium]